MLSYLPEKVYESIKNNKDYALLADELTEKIFGKDEDICFVQSLLDYVSENPLIEQIQKASYDMVDKKQHKMLDILFTDDYECTEEEFNNLPIEAKLYYIYTQERGDTTLTVSFGERVKRFLKLYEEIKNKEDISDFIHIVKYTYVLFNEMIETQKEYPHYENVVKKWFELEEKEYKEIFNYVSDSSDSVKNILYHKRIQMVAIYFELFGQFIDSDNKDILNKFVEMMDNKEFKYNDFNWFKISFNYMMFQYYIDNVDYENALKHFSNVYNLVEYSFKNKRYAIKALNHFNKAFLGEYLGFVRYFFVFVTRLLPSIKAYLIKEIGNLKDQDKLFIYNDISDAERVKIYKLINTDTPYSLNWALSNKSKIAFMNEIILDNQE